MNALGPGDRLPVLVVGIVFSAFALISFMAIVSITIYKLHKNRLEIALKRELVERGMSPDEIATIIRAKPTKAAINDYCGTVR
jgi:hypothetical protein